MRFLSWLFHFSERHHMDAFRYERGGVASRIFISVVQLILGAASMALEMWCLQVFQDNILAASLAFLLFICVAATSLDVYALYAYLGLSRAVFGTLDRFLAKSTRHTHGTDAHPANPSAVPGWLDLFVGIFSIVVALTSIVMWIYLFSRSM